MEVLYRLKANESLLLDDPEKVWVVKSGSLSLFATEVKDGEPVGADALERVKGHRRYLFSVDAFEALFGAAPDNPKSFLAVAMEATELSQITIADLAAQIAAGKASATAIVENWINNLDQVFTNSGTATNFQRFLSLTQKLATQLPSILADLHTDFFDYLNLLTQQETEAASRSFVEREQLNRQVVDSALSKLASVLQPQQEAAFFQSGTPLLVAVGAVEQWGQLLVQRSRQI